MLKLNLDPHILQREIHVDDPPGPVQPQQQSVVFRECVHQHSIATPPQIGYHPNHFHPQNSGKNQNRTAFELGPPSRKRERPEWLWRKTTENTECTEKKKPDKWQMTNDKFPMTNFFARRPGT